MKIYRGLTTGLTATLLVAAAGCNGKADGSSDDAGESGTEDGATGDDGEDTGDADGQTDDDGGATDGTDGGTDDGDGGGVFVNPPDGGIDAGCDPGLQDCKNDDEKCTAYLSTPGGCCVDANKCVPVIGDKQFGDLCERSNENDDCAKGLFCMTKTSGMTGEGICMPFCDINAGAAACEVGECIPFNDGVLPLCEQLCDPLLQDCDGVFGCYAAFDKFVCAKPGYEDGKGNDGDDCYTIQSCLPGLVCSSADTTDDCMGGDACCTPFCDLTAGEAGNPACVNANEQCVPWFDMDVPPGHEDVGACVVPI